MIRVDGVRLLAVEAAPLRGSVAPLLLLSAACHVGAVVWGLSGAPNNEIDADAGSAVLMTVTIVAGPEAGSPAPEPARPEPDAQTNPLPVASVAEPTEPATETPEPAQTADRTRSADRQVMTEAETGFDDMPDLPASTAVAPVPPPRPTISAAKELNVAALIEKRQTATDQQGRNDPTDQPTSSTDGPSSPTRRDGMSGITQGAAPHANNPAPSYPASARRRGQQGRVVLRVEVTPEGQVGNLTLETSSGHKALDRAALETVRRWRFRPATKDGLPFTATVQVPIRFALN